ncbi:MAG: protein phosphatase CheZ [Proteobacteria bacterium]|nr:protein phosphatase CheZ [Pseudomonadota bacterium]MBU1741578.1 protein phosphatase CheZ [Pseudomonadota bacterium]
MTQNLPQINLELNRGTFRIHTDQAVYHILVRPESTLSQVVDQIIDQGLGETPSPPTSLDWPDNGAELEPSPASGFYRDLSEDMYREIGRLARELSVSLKDVTIDQVKDLDLEATGRRLEAAKGELQDVVDMTERATMDIIDRTEAIQQECAGVTDHVERLRGLDLEGSAPELLDELAAAATAYQTLVGLANRAVAVAENVAPAPAAPAPEPAPETPPPSEPVTRQVLDVPWDGLFQSLYEFCTNEVVKKHIQGMGQSPDQFDLELFRQRLRQVTEELTPDEDNFIAIPLAKVFELLFKSTGNEDFHQLLRKMNSTIAKIFLEPDLTVEPQTTEITETPPAPPAPEPAASEVITPSPADADLPEDLAQTLAEMKQVLQDIPSAERVTEAATEIAQATLLGPDLKLDLSGSAQAVAVTMGRINEHVTAIIESLTFQDLSGQQIKRIVSLIGDFQVQVLALVVSFGSRMRTYRERGDLSLDEGSKVAQRDVDTMLDRIKTGDEEGETGAALDQNEVDRILGEMGF